MQLILTAQSISGALALSVVFTLQGIPGPVGAAHGCSPGVERWGIKSHLEHGSMTSPPHSIPFADLVNLEWQDLLGIKDWKATDECLRIAGATGPQECDIVSVDVYVQLVALECAEKKGENEGTDGDYHIQVSSARDVRDGVVIVEIPRPEFVDDLDLKTAVSALRETLREKLHSGREFSMGSGTCMQHPPRMRITGQLFVDSPHGSVKAGADPGGGRGKHGHKAVTI